MKNALSFKSMLLALISIVLLNSACTPAPSQAPQAIKASDSAKPAPAATKPAEERPPIKIGYLVPLTGPSGGMGVDMRDGFALYLEEKGGSLAGRPLTLITEDDEMNPQTGLTKAKKLVERDGVQMLAGIISSAVAYAVADYVTTQKILLYLNNAGADDLTQRRASPYIFRSSFANSQQVHPLGEWAYKKGYRKASLVAAEYAAGWEYIGGFARTFTQAGGQIVQEQYLPLGAPDPSPLITAIKPEADVVFALQNGADALRFVPAYDQYGVKQHAQLVGISALTDESILPKEGDSAIGTIGVNSWTAARDDPATKAFVAAFQKRYNKEATLGAAQGYDGAMLLEKALLAVDGKIEDKEAFISAMEDVSIPDGPRGPVKFDAYHNAVTDYYITEAKRVDGKLVNAIIDTYKDVSQFWKWGANDFMSMPTYESMKGKWVK